MAYLIFRTGAGHQIAINPTRQKRLFLSFQEGLIAESRLQQRQINYENVRKRQGLALTSYQVSLVHSLKKQLVSLDFPTFAKLDRHIFAMAEKPTNARSRPKHFRWFRGNLRLLEAPNALVVYTVAKTKKGATRILVLSIRILWRAMERG